MQQLIVGLVLVATSAVAAAPLRSPNATSAIDLRQAVDFPAPIKLAMLERMRRNLFDIQRIQLALAESDFDRVAEIAEFSLGLSSLGPHNARQAPYMPEPMQRLGRNMHAAASRVALTAQEADSAKTLAALAELTGHCVACHATYRAQ